jgi:hypothetical protein
VFSAELCAWKSKSGLKKLATQRWMWEVVKGCHADLSFWLACGLKISMLYEGGERGALVPHGLHSLADTTALGVRVMVGTQLLLLWLNLQASSCHHPFQGRETNYRLLVPLLAGRG